MRGSTVSALHLIKPAAVVQSVRMLGFVPSAVQPMKKAGIQFSSCVLFLGGGMH